MRFLFITLFPEQIEQAVSHSIIKRGIDKGLIEVSCINPREFTTDKHRTVDDTPFGGGAGMVLKPEPMVAAIRKAKEALPNARVIAMCPGGRTLKQSIVEEYAHSGQDIIFVCGHYEGFDERIRAFATSEYSIGDYVLTGGELPAMVMIDTISRLIPGVIKEQESYEEDSFYHGLLEYPHYTRPQNFEGMEVPEILLSGHHENIRKWRKKESLRRTLLRRPDLLENYQFSKEELKLLEEVKAELAEAE